MPHIRHGHGIPILGASQGHPRGIPGASQGHPPGYLLCMKFFCLSAVFEYGLISYLLQVETAQERKFLAFKHLAATVRPWDQGGDGNGWLN